MSYQVFSINGYGVELHYKKISAERFISFMRNHKALADFYETFEQTELNDMADEDVTAVAHEYEGSLDCVCGLMAMIRDVVADEKEVNLCACDDFDGREYILFTAFYPWEHKTEGEQKINSKEDVINLLTPYLTELYGEEVDPNEFGYQDVTNGG